MELRACCVELGDRKREHVRYSFGLLPHGYCVPLNLEKTTSNVLSVLLINLWALCFLKNQSWVIKLTRLIFLLLISFIRSSDVYAFGTVWYELLTGEWPWKQRPPESIIWQVGHGIKPTLANLQVGHFINHGENIFLEDFKGFGEWGDKSMIGGFYHLCRGLNQF